MRSLLLRPARAVAPADTRRRGCTTLCDANRRQNRMPHNDPIAFADIVAGIGAAGYDEDILQALRAELLDNPKLIVHDRSMFQLRVRRRRLCTALRRRLHARP